MWERCICIKEIQYQKLQVTVYSYTLTLVKLPLENILNAFIMSSELLLCSFGCSQ